MSSILTKGQLQADITRRKARANVMRQYLEAYELLVDNNAFDNNNMPSKNAAKVYNALKKEEDKIQNLRRQLHGV